MSLITEPPKPVEPNEIGIRLLTLHEQYMTSLAKLTDVLSSAPVLITGTPVSDASPYKVIHHGTAQ